jgi:hypothetical protein
MQKEKIRITQEQGNLLLQTAGNFSLPEKLGDTPFNVADRVLAAQDVATLYRELKAHSPKLQKDRMLFFGPSDNWEEQEVEGGKAIKLKEPNREVEIRIDEDMRSGAYYCLLTMFHPASQQLRFAGTQSDVLWPLAKRLRLVKALQKELGVEKAQHKRLDLDPEEGEQNDHPAEVEAEPVAPQA